MNIYVNSPNLKFYRWLLLALAGLVVAGCGSNDLPPLPTSAVVEVGPGAVTEAEVPLPEIALGVVMPVPPADCGPEAAITFAQFQSDLALAAVAYVNQAQQHSQEYAAQTGIAAFTQAHEQLSGYPIPDCLATAQQQALAFFQARIAGYRALLNNDAAQYEHYLAQGEEFRRAMTEAINGVLSGF